MGTLYVVSTPIGNLEDISLRALRILKEVSLIAAEDTRHTRKLLNHFDIHTPTISYHQHSGRVKMERLLEALVQGDVALVTDAGTPGLSDPGGELVEAAAQAGFTVAAVPGASALLTLLASSGLPASRFSYLGFLPRKGKERTELLKKAASNRWPFVIYEATQRLQATLHDISVVAGDRQVAVGRELTKLHEEVFRGRLSQAKEYFASAPVRGEVAIMVGGAEGTEIEPSLEQADLDSLLVELRAQGLAAKEAARMAANAAHVSTKEAYNRLLRLEARAGEKEEP